MSKLPKENKFVDLSDYGRAPAVYIANTLKYTSVTSIHVTIGFIISGLLAVYCILVDLFAWAAFFLILKSILDAADGELSRVKKQPSYVGRYLDSVADVIINILIFVAIWSVTESNFLLAFFAFVGVQLQGTLYNYYYVILRNRFDGDTTSRVLEDVVPKAMPGESQKHVNILFFLYRFFYAGFDKVIFELDPRADQGQIFPNWLMTLVSTFGLGFQLLMIAIFLIFGFKEYIIPFFFAYSFFILIVIGIRRLFFHHARGLR